MKSQLDTITAIATPQGHGGIGLVRLSGYDSVSIAMKIFSRSGGDREIRSHLMMHGYIIDPATGRRVDEVLLTVMISPKTYTTEDTVEINCHGGSLNCNQILNITIRAGARLAKPGEFTRRAFLNGRINLLQVEGVIDLISSRSESGHDAAFKLLDNSLFEKIENLKKSLFSIAMEVESEIDFSEEDISTRGQELWCKELKVIIQKIDNLLRSYSRGKISRDGIRVAIIGKPNVGKSSLMNALLREDRVIVSNTPGTTRDTIEESLSINGLSISLTDTAGFQDSGDLIEQEGIRRSRLVMEKSHMVLAIFDCSEKLDLHDRDILKTVWALKKPLLFVSNKTDRGVASDLADELKGEDRTFFMVSAKTGDGMEELTNAISSKILNSSTPSGAREEPLLTRKRQYDLLARTGAAVLRAIKVLDGELYMDMVAEEVRDALSILAELTGESYSDEILDRIFSEFCVGK